MSRTQRRRVNLLGARNETTADRGANIALPPNRNTNLSEVTSHTSLMVISADRTILRRWSG